MLLKAVLLVAFFALMVIVGFLCRRSASDVSGFVLGGRKAGSWLTAFAYGTSYFSAVIFVGYAGQFGWKYGLASTWVGLGNAFIGSLLAWVILGRRTRLITQQLDSSTMPEFFGKRFGSGALKTAASVIVFIFLVPYTASLYNGLSRLFAMAFDIDYTWCVLLMAVLTGAYVLLGGYMATAVNDFIQGIIMIFGIILVVGAVLRDNGGFMNAIVTLSKVEGESSVGMNGSFVSFFGPQPLYLLGVVLLTSLGTWGLPQMVGKFYAIKNESAIAKGTVISTAFAFLVAGGCYFLGGFGRLYSDSIEYTASGTPVFDSIIPSMLSTLPDIVIGVVVILVMSASMSTLSSLVITSSSTLTLDIIAPLAGTIRSGRGAKHPARTGASSGMAEKTKLVWLRLLVVFFIVISAAIAIVQAKSSVTFIAQLMGISWGALAGAFLAPFLYGLYWKRTTAASVWVSFGSGILIMVGCMWAMFTGHVFISPYFTSPINAGFLAMLSGLVIVPVVSALTKAPDKPLVEDMFSCYDRLVVTHASVALSGEDE